MINIDEEIENHREKYTGINPSPVFGKVINQNKQHRKQELHGVIAHDIPFINVLNNRIQLVDQKKTQSDVGKCRIRER